MGICTGKTPLGWNQMILYLSFVGGVGGVDQRLDLGGL